MCVNDNKEREDLIGDADTEEAARLLWLAKQKPASGWWWENPWAEDSDDERFSGSMGCLVSAAGKVLWYGMDGYEGIYCPNSASARLITSAPHLVAACKEMVSALRFICEQEGGLIAQVGDALDAGIAALAKSDA